MIDTAPAATAAPTPADTSVPKTASKKDDAPSPFAMLGLLLKDGSANAELLKSANLSPEMQSHLSMNFFMNGLAKYGLDKLFEPLMGVFRMFMGDSSEDLSTKLNAFDDTITRLDKGSSAEFMTALKAELKDGKIKLESSTTEEKFLTEMTKLADAMYMDNGMSDGEKRVLEAKFADNLQAPPQAQMTTTTTAPAGMTASTNQTTTTPSPLTASLTTTTTPAPVSGYNQTFATHLFSFAQSGKGPDVMTEFRAAVTPNMSGMGPNMKPVDLIAQSLTDTDNETLRTQAATMRLG